MQLVNADWLVIAIYGAMVLSVGLIFARRAGRGTQEFFLSGRKLPWWLLGTSMVATTFSTDTPNLVTDMVRTGGVSQNWMWWAFLITGMCTVFFYAKLWRRSGALTDIGFYELRYSGSPAAFLRGFRALYLGVFFNIVIMASVTLAAIKISGVLLGLDKYTTVLIAGSATALYSATSGLWGVVVTDLLLFVISMIGALSAAYFALQQPAVGGLSGLVSNPALTDKLSLLPDFTDWRTAAAVFIVPIAIQWWSTWYPARNEKDAMAATLWFNIAHYALRPWPWLIVGLASLIVFPSLESITARFPGLDPSIVRHDLAYPAMLVFVPHGLLGLVVASLAAAYMSTVSTHLNWGASYVVDDFYRRFVAGDRDERHYVTVGRIATVLLTVGAALVALWLENALQAFRILLQIGAGTGLIFLLRWFWWRINAWSEIAAMVISFTIAVYFEVVHEALGFAVIDPSLRLVLGVAITTVGWIVITLVTPPTKTATLQSFYDHIQPFSRGWRRAVDVSKSRPGESISAAFLAWFLGCAVVYGALFGTGFFIYGQAAYATLCFAVVVVAGVGLFRTFPRVGFS
jgi:Na+/proline symporter